jgi:hypothetical protein
LLSLISSADHSVDPEQPSFLLPSSSSSSSSSSSKAIDEIFPALLQMNLVLGDQSKKLICTRRRCAPRVNLLIALRSVSLRSPGISRKKEKGEKEKERNGYRGLGMRAA